tara:strand:+ start:1131 stop:1832 length:702 start_codon:yes stop_codon:yes gene_type:complete
MKQLLLILAIAFTFSVSGQRGVIENLKGFDENKIFHFGFSVGLNYMGANLGLNNTLYTNDTILGLNVKQTAGFTLAVVTDLHLGRYWDLRALFPTLAFGQRDFEYLLKTDAGTFLEVRQSEATYLALPIELKYKSERYGNWRAYVTGGGFLSYDMVSQKKADEGVAVVRLDNVDYGYSVGFGLEFFLEYFKFSPHIKWSNGLNNLLINDNTRFTSVIDKITARTFSISLTFEG